MPPRRKKKKARTSKEPTPPPIEEPNPSPPPPTEEPNPSPPPPTEEPNPSPPSVQETDSPPPPQDNEEDTEPLQPEKMFFPHTEFCKSIKIASKCEDSNTIKALCDVLARDEINWFKNHPQFRHILHMPRQKNHKLMGMWLTLLRTVVIEKGWRMCWFVVNGIPIRYSLREHGLISGLDCRNYPRYYKKLGDTRFVKRMFGRVDDISVSDVREKLMEMRGDGDRIKMAVLLFLSTVIGSKQRYGVIDPLFFRIVDDLHACETFPWGDTLLIRISTRYST